MENPCRMITFGDSITKAYTPLFTQMLVEQNPDHKIEVINEGVIGETTNQALVRLPRIIDYKPDVVIVGFGMNDWRKDVNRVTFQYNLRQIVSQLEAHKIRVVLTTINPDYQPNCGTSYIIDKYNQDIKDIAWLTRIRVADVNELWKQEVPSIKEGLYDEIHPNDLGNQVICQALLRIVPRSRTTIVWMYNGEHCACNYKCEYCYVPSQVNTGHHFYGTLDQWHAAFKNSFGNQKLTFYFSYGEPTIGQNFFDVLEMIGSEPDWEVMMTTNLSTRPQKLVNTKLAKNGRFNINTSFHPTQTSLEPFLDKSVFLREHGIEVPIIIVMYPEIMPNFEELFNKINQAGFVVHVRRFRGLYKGKWYPRGYTDAERKFISRYCDTATIKYMLNNMEIHKKKLFHNKPTYAGMFHLVVNNVGDIGYCTDYLGNDLGNVLTGNIKLPWMPQPYKGYHEGTVSGLASLLELNYHELEGNHVLSFAKQGGVFKENGQVHYKYLHENFSNPKLRQELNFPSYTERVFSHFCKQKGTN